jgi:SnoaL-like domain
MQSRRFFTCWIGAPLLLSMALVMGNAASTAGEREATTKLPEPRSSIMNVNQWVINYISCWNEHDVVKRRRLVAQTWAEEGAYVDAHRRATGQEALDAMLAKAQETYPGFRLRLIGKIETHSRFVRFSWGAGGTDEAPLYLGGTDFVTLGEDGRALSVVGFVDASPAAP